VIGSFRRFWLRRLLPSQIVDETHVIPEANLRAAIAAAPCEPIRAPEDHVARAKANRAAHYRALGEDPDADWGPFDAATIGWAADRHPGDAA
jgi:hypothetical protein